MAEQTVETAPLYCSIITPKRTVFDAQIQRLSAESTGGSIEILPRHEPLMVPLAIDLMELVTAEGAVRYAVHGGFLDMDGTRITILADAAELADEINVERAQASLARAKERLEAVSGKAEDIKIDMDRAQLALLRALNRLRITESVPNNE